MPYHNRIADYRMQHTRELRNALPRPDTKLHAYNNDVRVVGDHEKLDVSPEQRQHMTYKNDMHATTRHRRQTRGRNAGLGTRKTIVLRKAQATRTGELAFIHLVRDKACARATRVCRGSIASVSSDCSKWPSTVTRSAAGASRNSTAWRTCIHTSVATQTSW